MRSLRTVVITINLPYPMLNGTDIRNWQNINGLNSIGKVGVFALHTDDAHKDKVPPVSLAFWQASSDSSLTCPLPEKKLKARAWLMEPTGHPSDLYFSDTIAAELEKLMSDFRPHVVALEGLWLHCYIQVLRQHNCRIVLDNHNVEAAVTQEIANSTSGNDLPARIIRDILPGRVRTIERKVAEAVDQVWVCSSEDAQLMKEIHRTTTGIHVVPNAVNVDRYGDVRAQRLERPLGVGPGGNTIIFLASFRWQPNARASFFLLEEIFPHLVEIYPDCRLLLVGSNPTSHMLEVAKKDSRIAVTGLVPDVRPYLAAASLLIAPIFQGGGTRFKILEAFATNTPVISTAKGAEGLEVKDGVHILFAESAPEFVDAVRRLWADEPLAKHLARNAFDLVNRQYSWQAVNLRIKEAISSLELAKVGKT